MSARDLKEEIERTMEVIRRDYLERFPKKRSLLFQDLDQETAAWIEQLRQNEEEGK